MLIFVTQGCVNLTHTGVNFLGGCAVCIIFKMTKFSNSEVRGPSHNVVQKKNKLTNEMRQGMFLPPTMKQISLHVLRTYEYW